MHDYSMADIERLIGLSRGVVRALVRQRFVAPRRGQRREYRFSFQDLLVLRTAKALSNARLSNRRITRSLRSLRQRLPAEAPLAGLSLRAVGDAVSIREGTSEWEGDTGQYLLALDVIVRNGTLRVMERAAPPAQAAASSAAFEAGAEDPEQLFDRALGLEDDRPQEAIGLYQRCLELDRAHVSAQINCARLLQQAGEFERAERMYRHEICVGDPQALFNLGVLLEDVGRASEAIQAYLAAVAADPDFADAHFNLARLYEAQGNDPHMIRHLRQYRSILAGSAP